MNLRGIQTLTSVSMSKEAAAVNQAVLNDPDISVNLDFNPASGELTWGCVQCGALPLTFSDSCKNGDYYPGCGETK